jgi:hypothetical protein
MHVKTITATIAAGLIGVLLLSCNAGDKSVILRFRYEPGLRLTYSQITERRSEVTEADTVVKVYNATIPLQVEQTIRRVLPDSSAELVERDSWDFTAPSEKDSTKLDTLKGSRELVLYVMPNGKILDIDFVSEIDSASAEYIQDYIEQASPVFPSHALAIGQGWTQETSVTIDSVPTRAATKYEFTRIEKHMGYECAVIAYDGTLAIPVKANPKDSTQRHGVDRIRSTGNVFFAWREGCVVMQTESWTLEGVRERLSKGVMKPYKVDTHQETQFVLKERKTI